MPKIKIKKGIKLIILIILAVAIGLMSLRLIIIVSPQRAEKADTEKGVSYIQELEKKQVPVFDDSGASGAQQKIRKDVIKNGNYKAAFKDIIISGDSLAKSIWEYKILTKKQVMAEIGAGAEYLSEISDTIIAAKPKYLILHYGENELDKRENASLFIDNYKKSIQYIQRNLPNTKIYIDSIFPVLDIAYEEEPYTKNIDYYNEQLAAMAQELGLPFLDWAPIWNSFSKNYYDTDGIHPTKEFYTDQYLPYVYTEVKGIN